MKKTYYITTPIYFANDNLHIGHSYTTVAADTMARYKKMRGFDVKFLTGTDEHGQKIERAAKAKNVSPKDYVDNIAKGIKSLWKTMDIDYDYFLRTTNPQHELAVQKIFKKLYDQGDIYKSEYEGLYCTPCETFFTEHQLVDGKCPDCSREIETVKEESYFFKLSKYQDRLLAHIEQNPEFIMPQSRQNEMINNFLKPGLEDLCVSRTSFKWGIPVDFDPDHVVYVWIDALPNYATALGFLSDDDSAYQKYWPADLHLVGKEIVRFHTIIWPIMLMALGEPLPKQVFGHGWLILDGGKMSKSKGNVIDPKRLIEKYGVDAIRYFLMREIPFGQDGNFSNEALMQRINSDLANDLGNLLSRTVGMIDKYFGESIPAQQEETEFDDSLVHLSQSVIEKAEELMDKLFFSDALNEIWTLIRRANKYIDETEPWILAKDESKQARLANVLYVLTETLRITAILITPFMPNTPKAIFDQLCITDENLKTWESAKQFGSLAKTVTIHKGDIVFPRIDIKKELQQLEQSEPSATISIEDFTKAEMKIGEVLACEPVEKSDKLLKSQIKVGEKTHQIVSGIAKHYTPEQLIGKKVVVVTNLKPVKLRGILSEGMILAASDDNGSLTLLTTQEDIQSGAVVS